MIRSKTCLMAWAVPGLMLALAALPAKAADIPVALPVKAPVLAPVMNWYGSFIGVHAGYGFGRDPVRFTGATGIYVPDLGVTIPASLADDPRGFIGGVQWGTNWQFQRWVLGFYSDFSYADIKRTETLTLLGVRTNFADQRLRWFGTTRLRAGYLVQDNVLLYGTGGLASGTAEVNVSNNAVGVACAVAGACPRGSRKETRWGWAAGGGIEVANGPWSFVVEYLHYDLGSVGFTYGDGISPATLTTSTKFSGDIVRAGINYRFNWTFFDLLTGRARL